MESQEVIINCDLKSGERMTAPREIKRLVARFRENRDVYCSGAYNEAQARHEFIDPLANNKPLLQRQIDQLVHVLYGLTDEEIRIVEEATRSA